MLPDANDKCDNHELSRFAECDNSLVSFRLLDWREQCGEVLNSPGPVAFLLWIQAINDGRLALVRLYDTEGKSVLKYRTLMPAEERFSPNNITSLLKGGRAGRPFAAKVAEVFPELDGVVDAGMNQDAMREKIQEVADAMPDDQKEAVDLPLLTGSDKSIVPMIPAPIYIPAV